MTNRTRILRFACVLLATSFLVLVLASCGGGDGAKKNDLYYCPMHPTYVSNKPGECPICHMTLVRMEPAGSDTTRSSERHDAGSRDSAGVHAGHGGSPSPSGPGPGAETSSVPGYSVVRATDLGMSLAGIQTTPAVRGDLVRSVRAVGTVEPNETLVYEVHARVSGWVVGLVANFKGQFVRKGEPLLSLYSPELLGSQDEYLRAREAGLRLAGSELEEVSKGAADLVQAAHHRLVLFGVPLSLIDRIEKTGRPEETVTLVAPQTGFVTGKDIFDGTRIEPGLTLFTITDLANVWVEADVYEEEAWLVAIGTTAVITLPYRPDFRAVGNASFIAPTLDPATRTVKVRFEIPNPDLELKPGMFANVEINAEKAQGILIPDDAIIDSGLRKVVFVVRGTGVFEPRDVKVGLRGEGRAQILAGVEEGDLVVIHANFLLDSESRLKAALTGFSGQHQHEGTP